MTKNPIISASWIHFFPNLQYLEKNGVKDIGRENFSFSTRIFIGDFLKPTGVCGDNGEEKYIRMNEKEMLEDVDKIRKENGWKPRKKEAGASKAAASSKVGADPALAKSTEQSLLAKLHNELMRDQQVKQQEELRLQKEALR